MDLNIDEIISSINNREGTEFLDSNFYYGTRYGIYKNRRFSIEYDENNYFRLIMDSGPEEKGLIYELATSLMMTKLDMPNIQYEKSTDGETFETVLEWNPAQLKESVIEKIVNNRYDKGVLYRDPKLFNSKNPDDYIKEEIIPVIEKVDTQEEVTPRWRDLLKYKRILDNVKEIVVAQGLPSKRTITKVVEYLKEESKAFDEEYYNISKSKRIKKEDKTKLLRDVILDKHVRGNVIGIIKNERSLSKKARGKISEYLKEERENFANECQNIKRYEEDKPKALPDTVLACNIIKALIDLNEEQVEFLSRPRVSVTKEERAAQFEQTKEAFIHFKQVKEELSDSCNHSLAGYVGRQDGHEIYDCIACKAKDIDIKETTSVVDLTVYWRTLLNREDILEYAGVVFLDVMTSHANLSNEELITEFVEKIKEDAMLYNQIIVTSGKKALVLHKKQKPNIKYPEGWGRVAV